MNRRRGNDPDQQAVYHAERVAFKGTPFGEPLDSDDFMRLADRLFTHDWWERHSIPVPIIEPTAPKDTTSYAWIHDARPEQDPVIRIAPFDIHAWVLAHEAAHVAQFYFCRFVPRQSITSHGREFRDTYLSIAEIVLGREAATSLSDRFDQFVKVQPRMSLRRPFGDVPRPLPEHDPAGLGLFPTWRLEQQQRIGVKI